jgi:hypothetical protein
MPSAIEQMVENYVRLKNRRALEELVMHRERLAIDVKGRSRQHLGKSISQIDHEIAVIQAGLAD